MTSGHFHFIPIESIQVNRNERQRRELTDISVLADSIRRLGLIHPLVITRDNVLVSGERRYSAVKSLGWTSVAAQYVDELEPRVLKAIELEENIKRVDITWQDRVNSVKAYHELRRSESAEWTISDTSEAIGLASGYVSELIQVGEELKKGNARVIESPKLSTAVGIVRRANERRDEQEMAKLKETIFGAPAGPDEGMEHSILVADFNKWCHSNPVPRFNFIHCDFPYGIGADAFNQGGAPSHGGYIDSVDTWDALMDSLAHTTKTLTTLQCHLMFWFAMRKEDKRLYEPTVRRLEAMGWDINPLPLIWMKSDGAGIIPDPERGPRQIYETCLLGSRGDRKIVRAVANAYSAPTVRDRHMSEKPEPMLRHFFGMLVDENTVMLDPTCGSGAAVRAAESLSAKYTLGLEINPEFAELAAEALRRSRNLKRAAEVVA